MPHLRLQVPVEWLDEGFVRDTGFDARDLLDHLVDVLCGLRMPKVTDEAAPSPSAAAADAETVPLINRQNLKHALIPVHHAGVGGDRSRGFLHLTFQAGNETPGRTADVRRRAAEILGHAIDAFVGAKLPALESVTVHVQDIDRDRGYTTTASRRRARGDTPPEAFLRTLRE